MADKTLMMSFMNEQGKKVSLRLTGIREDITSAEVQTVMNTILSGNVFNSAGGNLKVIDSAIIVEKNSQELSVK